MYYIIYHIAIGITSFTILQPQNDYLANITLTRFADCNAIHPI